MSLRQDALQASMTRLKNQDRVANQEIIDDLVGMGHPLDKAKKQVTKAFWVCRDRGCATKNEDKSHTWTGVELPSKKTEKKVTKKKITKKVVPVVAEEIETPVVAEEVVEEEVVAEEVAEEEVAEVEIEMHDFEHNGVTHSLPVPVNASDYFQDFGNADAEEMEKEMLAQEAEEIAEEVAEEIVEEVAEEVAEEIAPVVESISVPQETETFSDTSVQDAVIGSRKASFTISREGDRVEIKNDARTHRFTWPLESGIDLLSDRTVIRKMKGSNRALATSVFFMSLKTKQSDPMGCFGDIVARTECEGCALRHICR